MEVACFVVQVVAQEPGLSVVDAGQGKDWLTQPEEDFYFVPQIFGRQQDVDSP